MKISKKTIKLLAVILVSSAAIYFTAYGVALKKPADELLKVELLPIETSKGWGYEIKVDQTTYIKQLSIPAVAGDKVFASKEDAIKTGNLVMQKLLKGNMPSLSYEEVAALGVIPAATPAP